MNKISLKPKRNNPFSDQTIFWYPIIVTPSGNLISLNIATNEKFERLGKLSNKGYVLSEYQLNQENICFLYHGNKIDQLIDNFGEKAFITDDGSINYFFSEIELNDIYKKINNEKDSDEIVFKNIRQFSIYELSKRFGSEWSINISEVDESSIYSTNLISPHPIIQLIDTSDKVLDKSYYKELLIYLLRNDFLVSWITPDEIPTNLRLKILKKYNQLSNENKNEHYLGTIIEELITDIFNKLEIFRIIYLAVQCGSDNSILKRLMQNLFSLLPQKKQVEVDIGCINFQPKFVVKSVELHFIEKAEDRVQLSKIYECLKEISRNVKFYDIVQHKILVDEELIHKAMKNHQVGKRYRFISEISIAPAIDYSELHLKVMELANAIVAILSKKYSPNENYQLRVKELWVKKIGLKVFAPPQFESDVMYSLSQKWITKKTKDHSLNENGIKIMDIDLYCDYPVFVNGEFSFSFDYTRDAQLVYSSLNNELKHKYNFDQFTSNL